LTLGAYFTSFLQSILKKPSFSPIVSNFAKVFSLPFFSLRPLLQDKLFLQEFQKAKFIRNVGSLKERFIIILGYNAITSEIIKQANEYGLRSVVIEKDESKRDALLLENFTPTVYCLNADAHNSDALEMAGIKSAKN